MSLTTKRICFFGSYKQSYRNQSLIEGLRAHGFEVFECHDESQSFFRLPKLLLRLLKLHGDFDFVLMGFPNHKLVPLARVCTRKPIIFDPFISLSNSAIEDRGQINKYSLRAVWYWCMDIVSMRSADILLVDTNTHGEFYVQRFGVKAKRIVRVPVGADENVFYPREGLAETRDKCVVRFAGTYVPLQGVEFIIEAAQILHAHTDITFELRGSGQTLPVIERMVENKGLSNVTLIKERCSLTELAVFIREADIALGIFGERIKTNMVVPHKVYDAIASGVPVITAETDATNEFFTNGENICLCQKADAAELARAILTLSNDSALRTQIAAGGYRLSCEQFTPKSIVQSLVNAIEY